MAKRVAAGPLDDNPTVEARQVALELVQLRRQASLEREDVLAEVRARGQRMSKAKLGHLETGRNQPKYPDLELLTSIYNRPDRLAELWERVGKAKKRGWWEDPNNPDRDGPEGFHRFLGLEQGAEGLGIWQPNAITGLLQPKDFAETMIAASTPPAPRPGAGETPVLDLSPDAVRERADIRTKRQGVLDRAEVHIVLGEMALRTRVGDDELMRGTLAHIDQVAAKPNVTIQFLLGRSGPHRGQHGPFTRIALPYADEADPGVIYLEDLHRSRFIEERKHVEVYNAVFAELAQLAEPPDRTPEILRQFAKELYT